MRCFVNWLPPAGYDDDVAMVIYRHERCRFESKATLPQINWPVSGTG